MWKKQTALLFLFAIAFLTGPHTVDFPLMPLDSIHKGPHCSPLAIEKNFLCFSAGENLVPESQSQRKKINEEENDSFWRQQSWLYAEWLWLSEPNASSWPTDSFRNVRFFISTSTSSTSASNEWLAAQREPAAGSGLSVRLPEEPLLKERYKLPVHVALRYERERTSGAVLQESPAWRFCAHKLQV